VGTLGYKEWPDVISSSADFYQILFYQISDLLNDILSDSFPSESIRSDSRFYEFNILSDSILSESILSESIISVSGFAEFDILSDSILSDSGFAESGFYQISDLHIFPFLSDYVLSDSVIPIFPLLIASSIVKFHHILLREFFFLEFSVQL
jgi:hypothetical protein